MSQENLGAKFVESNFWPLCDVQTKEFKFDVYGH